MCQFTSLLTEHFDYNSASIENSTCETISGFANNNEGLNTQIFLLDRALRLNLFLTLLI